MKRLDDATIERAEAIFNKHKIILTGQGLNRRELRLLEREGIVESQLMKHKEMGQVIRQWKPVQVSEGIIKKV